MSFKRKISTDLYFQGEELSSSLKGIGFMIGSESLPNPNIEDTLISACIEGVGGDYRVLSLLTDWITIHSSCINGDRLFRALIELDNAVVRNYFSSILKQYLKVIPQNKLKKIYSGKQFILGDKFLIDKKGIDQRFINTSFLVPAGLLRIRKDDILSPSELAKVHSDYYFRLIVGPTYRADMISRLIENPNISPSDLARKTYGSFATAWEIINDLGPNINVFKEKMII